MAAIGEQVQGPRVGGTPTPRLPSGPHLPAGAAARARGRGAGRGRTALQAGIPRAPAPRPLGAPPRQPRAGGTPGGVGLVRIPQRPTTPRPRRSPEDIAALGLPTTPSARPRTAQPRAPTPIPSGRTLKENIDRRNRQLEEAGSFLEKGQKRRDKIKGGR